MVKTTTLARIAAKIIAVFLIIALSVDQIQGRSTKHVFSQKLTSNFLALKQEKLSHLHFYFHDTISGRKPSAIQIAKTLNSANNTTTSYSDFGTVFMADDPLTLSPKPDSKLVGKAQGIYGVASQSEIGLLIALNFVFVEGKYNGSTLSLLGRNAVLSKVREIPIVGGSGLFRFARGYAQARTHSFEAKTGNAIVEYNVFVFHY